MTTPGLAVAQAAENLVGCPFRLHGRDPTTGLDCVGLVLCALRALGQRAMGPLNYELRNLSIENCLAQVPALGLAAAEGPTLIGDVLLFRLGTGQFHLGVATTGDRLVHADAGLRRVVIAPRRPQWSIERHWRVRHI